MIKIGNIYKHKLHGFKVQVLEFLDGIDKGKVKCKILADRKLMHTYPKLFVSNLEEV